MVLDHHVTMRDSTTFFDQESEAKEESAAALTREFWGEGAGWIGRSNAFQVQHSDEPPRSLSLDHTPTSMKAIRDGLAAFRPRRRSRDDSTGPVERTREHGIVRPTATAAATVASASPRSAAPRRPSPDRLAHRDASIGDLAAGRFDDAQYPRTTGTADGSVPTSGDDDLIALSAIERPATLLGGVDPRLVRIALVITAVVLAIPLALALRGDDAPSVETDPGAVVVPIVDDDAGAVTPESPAAERGAAGAPQSDPAATAAAATDSPTVESDADSDSAAAASPAMLADPAVDDHPDVAVESEEADTTDAAASLAAVGVLAETAATVTEEAERDLPDCSRTYTAGAGDSWYRIADEAGVTPAALLEQNRSTLDSVIFPGSEICLPAGATTPSPPTTVAATPATTVAPTTVAPTTVAPTTTIAPAAPPSYSRAEVQALIREIWPDELEERALEIARRESNYYATADNGWCCVGVFQLYWTVHDGWLDDYGIHAREDLKDARKNITAAYALYQRSGGWGPWGG